VSRERWMALSFGTGSLCLLVGPFPGYLDLVGPGAVGVTFFVGSLFFTCGGALQVWLAIPDRGSPGAGRAGWCAAVVQLVGTLFFNATTFRGMHTALSDPVYDALVWRPDALGSIAFLLSGAIGYRASARRGWLPSRGSVGWWQPAVNLLGCILFGVAAVAGYVVPSSGSVIDSAAANWTTALGAACFLTCAVASLRAGRHPVRYASTRPTRLAVTTASEREQASSLR
jgi:hypothetical protein